MELASLLSIAVVVTKIELHRKVGSNPFPMHSLIWFKLLRTTNWKKSFLCGPSASNVASVGNLTWKVYFVTKAWVAEPNSTAGMLWNEDLGNNRQDMFTRTKITERIWTECRRNNSKVMTTVNQNRRRKITSPPMLKKKKKKLTKAQDGILISFIFGPTTTCTQSRITIDNRLKITCLSKHSVLSYLQKWLPFDGVRFDDLIYDRVISCCSTTFS